jgi:hypothetical protein
MGITSILGGEEIAAAAFKRTPEGWVFKTPPLRKLFGLSTFYQLDDAQKADIAALYLRLWRWSMLSIIPVIILVMILGKIYPGLMVGYDLAIAAVMGGIVGLAVWGWYCVALRQRLQGAQPTSATLSYGEQQRTIIQEMPLWRVLTFDAFSIILLGLNLLPANAVNLSLGHRIVGGVIFGACSLYFTYALLMKLKNRSSRA